MNFCATKFISLVAFEQLNRPTPQPGFRSIAACRPDAALSRASSHVAVRRPPFERTIGSVSRTSPFLIERTPSERPLFGSILGRCYQADEPGYWCRKGPGGQGGGHVEAHGAAHCHPSDRSDLGDGGRRERR